MDNSTIIEKLAKYQKAKQDLEQQKDSKIAEIEEKVLAYRMDLLQQVEDECKSYKESLEVEFDEGYQRDLTKVSNYIDVLKELLEDEQQVEDATDEVVENEHNRDDNSVL